MNSSFTRYAPDVIRNTKKMLGHSVLIIGDIGLDEYVFGSVRRISPEAPVPVVEVDREEVRLGLSANVAQNVASLGGVPILISVVGHDAAADRLSEMLSGAKVATSTLIRDSSRPTTRKTRVMVQNHHIVRVDYEQRKFLSPEIEKRVVETVRSEIANCQAVILQDYAKGVVSETLSQQVIDLAHKAGKKVIVDPNRLTPVEYYRGADLMTPNFDESVALAKFSVDSLRPDQDLVSKIGHTIMTAIESNALVITRGRDGMSLFENQTMSEMPTFARQVADVTGAGDTVIAAIALALASGLSLEESCAFANVAAGVVVGKVGCVPCSLDELKEYAESHSLL